MSAAKPKHQIKYLKKAVEDLAEIFDYIKLDNPEEAKKFIDKIDKSIRRLELFPQSGILPNDDHLKKRGYRIVIIDNYLVFYLVRGKTVEIRRIIHGKRRYEFLL